MWCGVAELITVSTIIEKKIVTEPQMQNALSL